VERRQLTLAPVRSRLQYAFVALSLPQARAAVYVGLFALTLMAKPSLSPRFIYFHF
jgi:hypothetical protein